MREIIFIIFVVAMILSWTLKCVSKWRDGMWDGCFISNMFSSALVYTICTCLIYFIFM